MEEFVFVICVLYMEFQGWQVWSVGTGRSSIVRKGNFVRGLVGGWMKI